MYKEARKRAGLSIEEAAFRANIGTRTLAKYEAGETTPPADVALKMAEVYQDPDLVARYCARECAIGRAYRPDVQAVDLASNTLRVMAELRDVNQILDRLVNIARDDVVSPEERAEFESIMCELCDLEGEIERMKILAAHLIPVARMMRKAGRKEVQAA